MHIDPTRDQFAAFKALDRDQPVNMLNLVRLREVAAYADGRSATGAEAYAAYGRESAPIFQAVGGSIIWRGTPKATLIGPEGEAWDIAFVARYPTLGAFLSMVTNPDYQAVVYHRQAAVADSRLVPMRDTGSGDSFG